MRSEAGSWVGWRDRYNYDADDTERIRKKIMERRKQARKDDIEWLRKFARDLMALHLMPERSDRLQSIANRIAANEYKDI